MVAKPGLVAVFLAGCVGLTVVGWDLIEPPARPASRCPVGPDDQGGRAAVAAYEAIAFDLTRGSLQGLGQRASVIAEFFAPVNREISDCARRLSTVRDLAAAREEFARLERLFNSPSARPAPTPVRI